MNKMNRIWTIGEWNWMKIVIRIMSFFLLSLVLLGAFFLVWLHGLKSHNPHLDNKIISSAVFDERVEKTDESQPYLDEIIVNPKHHFAIIPHFMIRPDRVDNFYKYIFESYNITELKNLNIVLISPNHFGLWKYDFISSKKWKLCFRNDCIYSSSLIDGEIIFSGTWDDNMFQSDYLFQFKHWKYKTIEHWIWWHFNFINKYFSWSNIYNLAINPNIISKSDMFINHLDDKFKNKNTLFIASVDFSHYVSERYAYIHDKKTLYTLINSLNAEDYNEIEVDCPNCLYILNHLANKHQKHPKLYLRDSSSEISWEDQNFNNTSRMFIEFVYEKQSENWLTIVFYWDLMYDRNVSINLPDKDVFMRRFADYFQEWDVSNDLNFNRHRKLFWLDFAGFNLETPVVDSKSTCQKTSKVVNFCSKSDFLPWLNDLWFNVVNLANNHSMDAGISAHKDTIKNLEEEWINYFWYVRHWPYLEKNYVYTWEIRGMKYAWHWYDFTITKNLMNTYCETLEDCQEEWYNNFVSVHWWNEYQTWHSISQEKTAHKLIDCWADLIIWHHPHVVQDIWWYKDKLIIYSLWNFLFDQWFSDQTMKWMDVLIDYQINWEIQFLTGEINSFYK